MEFMKRLDKCVNIVPVIAKADTLTVEEREAFRRRVRLLSDCAENQQCSQLICLSGGSKNRQEFCFVLYVPFWECVMCILYSFF